MRKIWLYLLFIYLLPVSIFGQKDYFATDSAKTIGAKLIDGGSSVNSRICQLKKGGSIVTYSPSEIKEYGFKDGRVYASRDIQLSDSTVKVFLEQLHKGETTLFYYKSNGIRTFFVEKDSSFLLELPKRKDDISYNNQLMGLTDNCFGIEHAVKQVSYTKKSLTKLIARYNDCIIKPFPHFRFGFFTGYEFLKLNPPSDHEYLNYFDYKYDGGFMVGLFVDNPIRVSYFSIHTELYYSKHGYSYSRFINNTDMDFVANISSLKLPILFRYTYPSDKFRPFVNLGGVLTYNIRNEAKFYETAITGNIIIIEGATRSSFLGDNQIGYSFGGGTEYCINYKNSLFFELRYNKLYSNAQPKAGFINLLAGINF